MSCSPVRPDDISHNESTGAVRSHEAVAREGDGISVSPENVENIESRKHESQEEILRAWAQEEPYCRVCDPVDEDIDDEVEQEAEVQRPFRDPGAPSKNEILEHNLTHIPPRPWCPHCVRGKSKDSPSLNSQGSSRRTLFPGFDWTIVS